MKVGDTVYRYEDWSKSIIKGSVKEIYKDHVIVRDESTVSEKGEEICHCPGEIYCWEDQLYTSADAVYEQQLKNQQDKINKYCNQIKTVEDLVEFPIDHCLIGEEYTDYEARQAYVNRTYELLGIKLPVSFLR